jgi:hypothetical protein
MLLGAAAAAPPPLLLLALVPVPNTFLALPIIPAFLAASAAAADCAAARRSFW